MECGFGYLSRGRPTRDRPAEGPPQSVGLRVPGRLRACARQISPTGAPGDRRRDPAVRRPATGSRRRDDPRLRRPAVDGLRTSAAHRRVPASGRFRCRRRRTAGAVPRGRGVAARADRLAAGAGARLAPRRARSRAGRFGVAPRDRGCPTQGPDTADATHGRAPVGTDARPSRCADRRRRRPAALAPEPHQGQFVEPVGRGHETAAGEIGTDRGDRRAGSRRGLGQRQLPAVLFHSVRTASADRVRRMAAPRRHLALVCFLHQAWRDTLDQAVDMYGKLLDRNRKRVEDRLDDMLKAQRHAVDRIVRAGH